MLRLQHRSSIIPKRLFYSTTQKLQDSKNLNLKDDSPLMKPIVTKFGRYQSQSTVNTINHDIALYPRQNSLLSEITKPSPDSKLSVPSITGYLKPKTFSLASGDGATDEYAYRQRRNALERIYDNEDNLAMANFILSYAGRSTIAPWSTKENYEYLVGTANCMSTFQDDQSRDNSKMLLSMYIHAQLWGNWGTPPRLEIENFENIRVPPCKN